MMLNKRESFISPALQQLHSNPGPEVTVEHRFYIANQNHSDLSNKVTGLVRNNKNLMSWKKETQRIIPSFIQSE